MHLIPYAVVFVVGRLSKFGDGLISDHFEKQKELRAKLTKPYKLTSIMIADAQKDWYKNSPSQGVKIRATRVAASIESLGKRDLAIDIREFMRYCEEYYNVTQKLQKKDAFIAENVVYQMNLRVVLDNLADVIFDTLAKDYTLGSSLWLKFRRFFSRHVIVNCKKVLNIIRLLTAQLQVSPLGAWRRARGEQGRG